MTKEREQLQAALTDAFKRAQTRAKREAPRAKQGWHTRPLEVIMLNLLGGAGYLNPDGTLTDEGARFVRKMLKNGQEPR
ncbi:hypothetical protein [Deinococcus fonticola]|uniref:hypothetical protein n=1 Tax=Deinococcus fonticola TaxID=2528713 RepID=UPI001074B24B|nr:hypothetical protein [Deinococcus fonticola]